MTQNYDVSTPGSTGPVPKTKWIVQLVVSFLCLGNIVTMIFAILGLVKADNDLPTAEKYYKWGWIAYVIGVVLWVILGIIYFAALGSLLSDMPSDY